MFLTVGLQWVGREEKEAQLWFASENSFPIDLAVD